MPKSRYPIAFESSKLKAEMQRAARDNGRSLNAEINQACKEHVKRTKK